MELNKVHTWLLAHFYFLTFSCYWETRLISLKDMTTRNDDSDYVDLLDVLCARLTLKLKSYEIKWVYHPTPSLTVRQYEVRLKVLNYCFLFGLLLVCRGSMRSFDLKIILSSFWARHWNQSYIFVYWDSQRTDKYTQATYFEERIAPLCISKHLTWGFCSEWRNFPQVCHHHI